MTKPGGTGSPPAVMAARLLPFPPESRTSLHASSVIQRIVTLFIDDPHCPYRRRGGTNPFNGKHGELKVARWELVEIHQVLDMPVIFVHHHHMGFPELFALEHGPDRRIQRHRIDTHQPHTLLHQAPLHLAGHATTTPPVPCLR